MRITLLTLLTVICCITTTAATTQASAKRVRNKVCPAYIYRITLTDKNKSPYSIDHPSRFLSRRSIERRKRQGLAIDSTDLPVSPHYIRAIENRQTAVIGQSRWNNTVLVEMRDTSDIQRIRHFPFVSNCRNVWQAPDSIEPTAIRTKFHDSFLPSDSIPDTMYGRAADQIQTTNGQRLHDIGYRGEGLTIAVLDGGFKNVNRIPAFSKVDIKGTRDFVFPNSPSVFYETDHGTRVLSIMAINTPYYYIGTAPQASYWLLRCEDPQSEQEVEEDYWAMAVEFADSVGCDLINSSLGYHQYDHGIGSHQLWQLDGHSTFISRTASMVIGKGIILVNSSGNTGMGGWKKLTFPADAEDCLTVGAVTEELGNAPFSAVGPTQDGRIKPDVVAIGSPATIVTGRGTIAQDMGTSFASPIICGLTACLWQALPKLTARQIIQLIRQTSRNSEHPDNITGYGLPNFWRAYMVGRIQQKSDQPSQTE